MNIAIVGATGLVGREILKILNEKGFLKNNKIFLYASEKSNNKKICMENKRYVVKTLTKENLINNYDFVFFSAGSKISKMWACEFTRRGAIVIDNSSAFRRENSVPLVVPEINGCLALKNSVIANPNCSTIGASLPIFVISKLYKIKRIVISTYQAVSGAGNKGIKDLKNKTTNKFKQPIHNNLIPQIDVVLSNGYTFEEDKMNFELKKILNNSHIKISATCVRVPIFNCHSESIMMEFDTKPDITKIKQKLKRQHGIKIIDNPLKNKYPMPIYADKNDNVWVGRFRKDSSSTHAISFFISFDNIRKGASLNAVQIMEYIIKRNKSHKI